MDTTEIKSFNKWQSSSDGEHEKLMGISRQFSHLSGLNLDPKGRLKRHDGETIAKFSVRPKPLKWKESDGWARVRIVIKNGPDGASFIATLDGTPVSLGPKPEWVPIRKASDLVEKIWNRLKK
jgi:hypothetical protein